MSFSCPHFDIDRDGCLRLLTDCVPGRPGCVLQGSVFATPVEERVRAREAEKRRRDGVVLPSETTRGKRPSR